MQALIWLADPLTLNSGDVTVVAANIDTTYEDIVYVLHTAGTIRMKFSHILIDTDVSDALWLVGQLAGFVDMRGLS
jgi:hypothetical protein